MAAIAVPSGLGIRDAPAQDRLPAARLTAAAGSDPHHRLTASVVIRLP